MIHYLILSLLFSFSNPNNADIHIYNYTVSKSTLSIYYSIKNNTDQARSVYLGEDLSTFPYLHYLSLLIKVNDSTLLIDPNNSLGFYPGSTYTIIQAHDSICNVVDINLKGLYRIENLANKTPYPTDDGTIYSFQFVYYEKHPDKKPYFDAQLENKIIKKHLPITDTLYSNTMLFKVRNL